MIQLFVNSLYDDGTRTLSILSAYDCLGKVFECKLLEPPWKDNKQNISCIPAGCYRLVPRWSAKYGTHYEVVGVPGRSLILIHWGNFIEDTRGCLIVGENFADLDADGRQDIAKSKMAFERLYRILGDRESTICIAGKMRSGKMP